MTEYKVNNRHGYEEFRADATPETPNLGQLNARDLKPKKKLTGEEIAKSLVHDEIACKEYPCFYCFPIDGCSG